MLKRIKVDTTAIQINAQMAREAEPGWRSSLLPAIMVALFDDPDAPAVERLKAYAVRIEGPCDLKQDDQPALSV